MKAGAIRIRAKKKDDLGFATLLYDYDTQAMILKFNDGKIKTFVESGKPLTNIVLLSPNGTKYNLFANDEDELVFEKVEP